MVTEEISKITDQNKPSFKIEMRNKSVDSFSEGFSFDKMSQAVHFQDQEAIQSSVAIFERELPNVDQSIEEKSSEASNQEYLKFACEPSLE